MTVVGTDVFVVGYDGDAKYWKNGTAISLTDGSEYATVNAITVVGTDVYVAGSGHNNGNDVAKYWKNGTAISLTDGSKASMAFAISVVGTDVYVAGFENNEAKYWKNGVGTNIATDVSLNTLALAMFI